MKHTSIAGLLLVLFIAVKICILCLVVSMFVGATTRAGAQSAKVLFDDSGPDSGRHHWIEDMCSSERQLFGLYPRGILVQQKAQICRWLMCCGNC